MSKKREHTQAAHEEEKVKSRYLSTPLCWRDIYTSKWFLPLVCVFVLAIILALRPIADIDIGFHLRGGQWILENMSFHKNDVFTYTVNHNEYIAMYWFFQVLLYVLFKLSGYSGLVIINTLFIAFVFFLLFMRMKSHGVSLWIPAIIFFLIVFIMERRFEIRPEIFTWIFLLLMLIILDQYFYHKKNYLFWLLIIAVLWVNFHGLFILGWIVMGAYLISIMVHERKLAKKFLKWSAISALVSIINPYFFKGIAFPFYLFTRLQGSSIFKNHIEEFRSPWAIKPTADIGLGPTLSLYLYFLITIASFILILITYKRRKIHEYLLLGIFFYLSFTAVRNIPLFIIIAIQVIALSLHDISPALKDKLQKCKKWVHISPHYMLFVFLVITILCSARVITDAYYISDRRAVNFGIGLDKYAHPVAGADFIVKNNLTERILNDLNCGSWLIWKIPQPVFIDGRLEVMQEQFFQEYLTSFSKGGLQKLINRYKPKLIIFDYAVNLPWNIQLRTMSDWRLIYWDETSVIYAHRDYALEFLEVKFIERVYEMGIDTTVSNTEVWDILKTPRKSKFTCWLNGFFKKQNYPYEPMKMGLFAVRNNEFRTGELLYLEFIRESRGNLHEVYFNLGSIYYYTRNDYRKALYCFERVLSEQPENTLAKQVVDEIKRK